MVSLKIPFENIVMKYVNKMRFQLARNMGKKNCDNLLIREELDEEGVNCTHILKLNESIL